MTPGEILRKKTGLSPEVAKCLWGVLPIYTTYAEKIYGKTKLFEYRKNKPTKNIRIVVLYETSPTSLLTGYFTISNIVADCPSVLWEETKKYAGIDKTAYDQYFKDRDIAYAYAIDQASRFDCSISLDEIGIHPPQTLRYI